MTMGERLRELRVQRNLSQETVARIIGITRSAYSHYEINNRQPVYDTLIKLAAFFHVTIDYIIEGDASGSDFRKASSDTLEIVRLLEQMDHDKRKQSIGKMMDLIREAE
ncbi:helix-turn-helix domain-containing protein [Paenibacillus sp. NEAU-GSW1]|uniref:helix-turn-helix domain-containing protein n=1 Tax=Paenibacillus sp. NEAU-GSW1 TaxID=2682486 RepID=UPI0012E221E2|nr:helix-turn-helix transcriptional regulator [Paenibacillus sp. NEAU-GSW1]MUT65404.1 helix-turn-helix domain-containing protein [Paenibacillus sp. NEAU-GSW1]